MTDTTTETPAHTQIVHLTCEVEIPGHLPRESDPHYRLFQQARARMAKLGLLKCQHCGALDTAAAPTELHHGMLEFCLVNAVDPAKLVEQHPECFPDLHGAAITDDEFQAFVEGPGNLVPLCKTCHTGDEGIHRIVYPWWQPLAWLRDPAHPIVRALNAGVVLPDAAVTTDAGG
jgi:hypothetical protein